MGNSKMVLGFFIPWIIKSLVSDSETTYSYRRQEHISFKDLSGETWTEADENQWQKDYGGKK